MWRIQQSISHPSRFFFWCFHELLYLSLGWQRIGLHCCLRKYQYAHRYQYFHRESSHRRSTGVDILLAADRCVGCNGDLVPRRIDVQGCHLHAGNVEFVRTIAIFMQISVIALHVSSDTPRLEYFHLDFISRACVCIYVFVSWSWLRVISMAE